jgi:hypothetical protein
MATHIERYHAMLAGRGMKVGDQVICTYRLPTPHQWWTAPLWVGVIEEAGTDATSWNGHNSEAYHCANFLYVKVRYLPTSHSAGFTQRDQLCSLLPIQFGDPVTESPSFGSDPAEAIRLYEFACRAGYGAYYSEMSREAWHAIHRKEVRA